MKSGQNGAINYSIFVKTIIHFFGHIFNGFFLASVSFACDVIPKPNRIPTVKP